MLKLDLEGLRGLLESFYMLTKLKVVLIDDDFKEVLAYPNKSQDFCNRIKKDEKAKNKCDECLIEYCKKCKQTGELSIYRCHVGLTEAIFPIKERDLTVGFIMFGQTTEIIDKSEFIESIRNYYSKYGNLTSAHIRDLEKIKVKSHGEIIAAAEILKTIANFITVKRLISKTQDGFIHSVYEYVDKHIYQKITADDIAKNLFVCRTTLFEKIKKEIPGGLNELINKRKTESAKALLLSTDLTIKSISEKLGFKDSNYFSKVFIKYQGLSPKEYKKSNE